MSELLHGVSGKMDYLHAFENCRSFNRQDGSISRNDVQHLCQKFGLKFDPQRDTNPLEPRVTFELFKQCIYSGYTPTSPRPSSGSGNKHQRSSVPSSHHHPSSSRALKYAPSPQGHGGYDREHEVDYNRRPSYQGYRPENKTPDQFLLSPEEQRVSRSSRHWDTRGGVVESPPPLPSSSHRPQQQRSIARSVHGDESDDSDHEVPFHRNPSGPLKKSKEKKHHQLTPDLQEKVARLEKENDGLRKELRAAQNSDLQYTSLLRDNERLRQELKKKDRGSEHDIDSRILERQVDDLRRTRSELEMELGKNRETIMDLKSYKKECRYLRAKHESQQRGNWQLMSENDKLTLKVVELEKGALIGGRRPGDSTTDDRPSELGFQRTTLRSTYHGSGKGEARESRSRKSNRGGLEIVKTSSAQVLDYHDEPQREDHAYSKAKTHRSGTYSDVSSVGEGLPLVTTTPDEQSQVFMVMGEDVSKSVLPDNLANETELALIYALQNCHSVQEIIKCLVSYGVGTPGENAQEFWVRTEHLESQIKHLKAKNTMLANSFENAKSNMESMYSHSQKVEANNTRLLQSLRHCYQACEIYEVLFELRITDRRNPQFFPSFDSCSLESSTRSPDREHHSSVSASSGRSNTILRARSLLHTLDSDTQLQNYLPVRQHPPNGTNLTTSLWGGSQNTGTTSGLSSMSGGIEGDITAEEIDRLRLYIQALIRRKNHYTDTLQSIDGLHGLEVVKNWELVKDCLPSGHGGQIMDLEDAANAEELCKVREEKAELRSQIYMMDQEKRRMELEVSRMLLNKQKNDKIIAELTFQLERRKRKREKKMARREPQPLPHEPLAAQLQASMDRERELLKRYEDLFQFLNYHTKQSHTVSEDMMTFVKDLWQQNSSLVDAFEKSTKRQQTEKKKMKQELVSLWNQIHRPTPNEEP